MGDAPTRKKSSKCNSAPTTVAKRRQKSKYLKSQTDSMKQIEEWAVGGEGKQSQDLARHSGQLMDNVTEERLLHSKLKDLSRARYKFMTQNDYERRVFLDRQQKKSDVLQKMLKGVEIGGRSSSRPGAASVTSRTASSRSRHADTIDSGSTASMPVIRHHRRASVSSSGKSSIPPSPRTLAPPAGILVHDSKGKGRANGQQSTKLPAISSEATPRVHFDLKPSPLYIHQPAPPPNFAPRPVTRAKTFTIRPSTRSVIDPRYQQLEDALAPKYTTDRGQVSVTVIVDKLDALGASSKRPKESKTKERLRKFMEFMKEKGLMS